MAHTAAPSVIACPQETPDNSCRTKDMGQCVTLYAWIPSSLLVMWRSCSKSASVKCGSEITNPCGCKCGCECYQNVVL